MMFNCAVSECSGHVCGQLCGQTGKGPYRWRSCAGGKALSIGPNRGNFTRCNHKRAVRRPDPSSANFTLIYSDGSCLQVFIEKISFNAFQAAPWANCSSKHSDSNLLSKANWRNGAVLTWKHHFCPSQKQTFMPTVVRDRHQFVWKINYKKGRRFLKRTLTVQMKWYNGENDSGVTFSSQLDKYTFKCQKSVLPTPLGQALELGVTDNIQTDLTVVFRADIFIYTISPERCMVTNHHMNWHEPIKILS